MSKMFTLKISVYSLQIICFLNLLLILLLVNLDYNFGIVNSIQIEKSNFIQQLYNEHYQINPNDINHSHNNQNSHPFHRTKIIRKPGHVKHSLETKKHIYTGSIAKPAKKRTLNQLPKVFDWCDNNDKSYCTASWNQHIPRYCNKYIFIYIPSA